MKMYNRPSTNPVLLSSEIDDFQISPNKQKDRFPSNMHCHVKSFLIYLIIYKGT